MPVYPKFRRTSSGVLSLADTAEARQQTHLGGWCAARNHQEVERDALEKVTARQGDHRDEKDVLGEYVAQFGKYRGQNFRWMLENVPGYVAWIVVQITKDEGKEDQSSKNVQLNKAALKKYVMLFEEGKILVERKGKEQIPAAKLRTLLQGRKLSPEQLKRRLTQMTAPPEFTPNIPTEEDRELAALVDAYESTTQGKKETTTVQPRVPPRTPISRAKRSLFLPCETTLAPAPREKLSLVTDTDFDQSTATCHVQSEPVASTATAESGTTGRLVCGPGSVQSESVQSTAVTSGQSELLAPVPIQETSTELLLYEGWKSTLPVEDQQWISKLFFGLTPQNKLEFKTDRLTQLWYEPPQPSLHTSSGVRVHRFFGHRLFVWMPLNIWGVQLHCPHTDEITQAPCRGVLTKAGMYQKTRTVVDVDSLYLIATEYYRCSRCGKKLVPWAHNIVSQLDEDRRLMFPCILTARLACDRKVIHLLRQRGLGNSSSSIHKQLQEAHGDLHLRKVHHYLTACKTLKAAGTSRLISPPRFEEPPAMTPVPQHRWLMKVYQLDVLQRLDFIKASMTSLFGTVLKMDSTKKITKKLAGRSEKTSMWATNIGNEFGQVIMTVLTASEGHGLANMINGICHRYNTAEVPPPRILYVDRDCCGTGHVGRYFSSWPYLLVRLDIWHFMRRLAIGCTTDAHPLYGTFMNRLSQCIFQWEEEDVRLLKASKKAEMIQQHIPDPSDADVVRHIKTDELALHCRRVTRGTRETTTLITQLIQSMDGDRGLDILGVPLIDSVKMQMIWAQQSHHVSCLQDPEGVQLYTRIGTVKKGGVDLPKYRCARGSTSLECFHLHMNRFIPGTLASDVNFQVYLLDGVHRWNQDRQQEATDVRGPQVPLSYDGQLKDSVNRLSSEVLGRQICPKFKLPGKYTGELIGLEYLFSQSTGASVNYEEAVRTIEEKEQDGDMVEDRDEGFEEPVEIQDATVPSLEATQPVSSTQRPLLQYPTNEEYQEMMTDTAGGQTEQTEPLREEAPAGTDLEQSIPDDSDMGPDNIPGYRHVMDLSTFLCSMREQTSAMTTEQALKLIQLWEALSDYDKSRTRFPHRFSSSGPGRFRSPKKQVALGVTSIERAILGPNATRANWPNCNRYVEATVQQLLVAYPSDRRSKGKPLISRWTLVKEAYGRIQSLVLNNTRVMEGTDIQLPSLNTKTITQWYNKKGKDRDRKILLQGISLPQPPMTGTGAPQPKNKPPSLQTGKVDQFQFQYPADTAGMAKLKIRKRIPVQPTGVRPILPRPPTTAATPTLPLVSPIQVTLRPAAPITPKRPPAGQVEVPKRKYTKTSTPVKCPKCGKDRIPPEHQQYMGYRYCAVTSSVPFQQWRAHLQSSGAARKK